MDNEGLIFELKLAFRKYTESDPNYVKEGNLLEKLVRMGEITSRPKEQHDDDGRKVRELLEIILGRMRPFKKSKRKK